MFGLSLLGYAQEGNNAPQQNTSAQDPVNPQMFGVSIPMLDPASDTVAFNGGVFDVGNNAAVRARFEKYLQQNPDESAEGKRYRKKIRSLIDLTEKSARSKRKVGSATLIQIGHGLQELSDYPGDGDQGRTLASAMASAIAVQYANNDRSENSAELEKKIAKLVKDTNSLQSRNEMQSPQRKKGPQGETTTNPRIMNTYLIGHNTKDIAKSEAAILKNDADSLAAYEIAKINYQTALVSLFFARRYEHAAIGANAYRHVFRDGETTLKMEEDSQASQLFKGATGMPPSVNTLAAMASTATRDVNQNMEAVVNLLAQNKLGDATQHLIMAVATGEYLPSVATFPLESRRRIAEYWGLRKRALTSLNARDYGTTEEIAKKMKSLDPDFDDSMLMSYCAGKKQESDLCLRNAVKALKEGNDEEFNRHIKEAGTLWPRNPKLAEGRDMLEKIDNQDHVREEFKSLYERKDFRTIYNEQNKFEVVAVDPALKEKYKDAITVISTIDGMLQQLEMVAAQDRVMGPCMAYETLLESRNQDMRYAEDEKFRDALNRYGLAAHDFVRALEDAADCEKRGEYGSALANYYRAQCLYPRSKMAQNGADRIMEIILKAKF